MTANQGGMQPPKPKQRQQSSSSNKQTLLTPVAAAKLQKPPRLRTNTRLCRETAITNTNTNVYSSNADSNDQNNNSIEDFSKLLLNTGVESEHLMVQRIQEDRVNGNVLHLHVNETAQMLMDQQDDDDVMMIDCVKSTQDELSQNVVAQSSTQQSKKIRITENPLPETVSC